MAAAAAPLAQPTSHQDLQVTAAALWTFVHLKVPNFTSEAALQVVESLQPKPDEDPKALAKRLRKALSGAGISLKHSAALDAASRILGYSSWHARNREPAVPKLKLTMVVEAPEEQFSSWHELAPRLAEWLEAWHQVKPTKVFEVRFGSDFILVCVPEPKKDSQAGETEMVPALAINPIGEVNGWLTEAPAASRKTTRRVPSRRSSNGCRTPSSQSGVSCPRTGQAARCLGSSTCRSGTSRSCATTTSKGTTACFRASCERLSSLTSLSKKGTVRIRSTSSLTCVPTS
ncbi:glyoxalase superfamily protein [Burkholderia pseudomallei]|uniref:glyoxalase superfamily protein n=1 Tax=Burkholderia pseudomallei TaxID=28450 RepID=UPI000A6E510A|nr:glyoxalase superfamily protein [Burkholderia pseudomallei]